jgi:3-hydroxyisobutyrate dehydrogenase-like beta-hydroxyacid dehydrogenase
MKKTAKNTAKNTALRIGWIGAGRMGYEMALRLAKAGCDITVWNRTRAKAEPLMQYGAKIASKVSELAACDVVFCMVSTYADVKEVIAGKGGLLSRAQLAAKGTKTGKRLAPRMVIECSSISLEGSAELREILAAHGTRMLAAPVSGNAKVIKAGKLSFVCSGPKAVFDEVSPLLRLIAPAASYVGVGELARIVKICHNVFLGVVIQSLCEITILAQKAGVPRHAFLEFMNQSVMGSVFSRYKTPALVNLDFKVTFTPALLRKDIDLGLDAGRKFEVPLPLASITRDLIQSMVGKGMTERDFATLLLQQAQASGIELEPENVAVSDGLA